MSFIVNRSAPRSVAPIVTPIHVTVELAATSDDLINASSWVSSVASVNGSSSAFVTTVNLGCVDNLHDRSQQAAISLPEVPRSLLQEHIAEEVSDFPAPSANGNTGPQDVAQWFAEPVVHKKTIRKKNKKSAEEKARHSIYTYQVRAAKEFERIEQLEEAEMCYKPKCQLKQFRLTCFCKLHVCDADLANGDKCSNERVARSEYCKAHLQEMRALYAPQLQRVQSAPGRIETTPLVEYDIQKILRDTPIGWRRRPSLPISAFDVARRGVPSPPRPLSPEEMAEQEQYIIRTFFTAKQVVKRSDATDAWKAKFAAADQELEAGKGPKVIRGGFEIAERNAMMDHLVSYTEAFLGLLKYELEPDEHRPEQDEEILSYIMASLKTQLEDEFEAESHAKMPLK